jgi:large subunit ribosomal protein L23
MAITKYDIIVKPIISEKSTRLIEDSKYMFVVNKVADKLAVAKAIEDIFNVKVKSVNIQNRKGKNCRFKGRNGKKIDKKIAFVTLKEGHSITIFEN